MKGLNVNIGIKLKEFLGEIYRISGINLAKYELIMSCLYNVKPFISVLLLVTKKIFKYFLTGNDVS